MKNRAGIALVLTLTVLLLVEIMTACMLALGTQARLAAAADMRSARADGAAQLALQLALAAASANDWDTLPAGKIVTAAAGSEADAVWSATIERLGSGLFIIQANGRVGGAAAFSTARAAAVARMLDGAAVLEEFNSALASAGSTVVAGASDISADAARLPRTWDDSVCPAARPLPTPSALITASPAVIGEATTIMGAVSLDTMLAVPDSVALGGVRWSDLARVADRSEAGTVTPVATPDDTTCDQAAPGNWGDPFTPAAACSGYFPLIYARGDLRMDGGAGQGILVVAGTLTLGAGASFVGVIVARGGLILEPGSSVSGSVRSEGTITLVEDAVLAYSRCAVARAVARTPAARRLIPQQRSFLPAF